MKERAPVHNYCFDRDLTFFCFLPLPPFLLLFPPPPVVPLAVVEVVVLGKSSRSAAMFPI